MRIFTSVFLTLAFAFSVFAQKQIQVIATSTYLRAEPKQTAEIVKTMQKGDRLILERKQDASGWYLVTTADNAVKGWIRKDTVEAAAEVSAEKPSRAERIVSTPATPPVKQSVIETASKKTPAAKPIVKEEPSVKLTPKIPLEAVANSSGKSAPIPAPTPDEEQEVIRVDTEEVNLNVRVVDAGNHAVKNLNQAQFKVYENGVPQTITSVSQTEAPMINALLIDNSRSLRQQLRSVIEAGKTIVGTNRPADETAVIRFVGADKIETVRDFTTNKILLSEALENLFVEGGQTAIIDAIYMAAQKIEQRRNTSSKDDIRLRALVLVSDGDDRASTHSEQELFDLLRRSQLQIYAVGFTGNLSADASRREKAKSFLTRLSEETGGRVFFPATVDEMPHIAALISADLHAQYLISYTPTDEKGDGSFKRLKVEVEDGANNEKRIAITRAGRTPTGKQ